jgi:FtsP/CotA-like multicopper oxidase with cupredoxin domain
VFAVKPAQIVLFRLIAASAATNFFIDTGNLDATIIATDGENVKPLKGNFFQLAVAQRLDLLVTIPATGGVFPILALAEGSTLQTGFLLATPGTEIPKPALGSRAANDGRTGQYSGGPARGGRSAARQACSAVHALCPRRQHDVLRVDDQRREVSKPKQL